MNYLDIRLENGYSLKTHTLTHTHTCWDKRQQTNNGKIIKTKSLWTCNQSTTDIIDL